MFMMQSELFNSAALEHKENGLRQLADLHFAAARDHFTIAKEIVLALQTSIFS